jgi:2-dehydropantoate 2-reductase
MTLNSLIAGPGAVGSLVCLHAQTLGEVTVFPHRAGISLPKTIVRDGQISELNWSLEPASPVFSPNLIWICTKAFNAEQVATTLVKKYPDAAIILLHNGMGPQEAIRKLTPNLCILGTTTCGAYSHKVGHYTQTLDGRTLLGCPALTSKDSESRTILDEILCRSSDFNLQKSDDIEIELWNKLLVNAVINPITAYYQILNGELLKAKYEQDISSICDEINGIRVGLDLPMIKHPVEKILNVAALTHSNRSSMAEDIRLHRKTEIDFINGYLIKKAKLLGLPSFNLEKWYNAIASRTDSYAQHI